MNFCADSSSECKKMRKNGRSTGKKMLKGPSNFGDLSFQIMRRNVFLLSKTSQRHK